MRKIIHIDMDSFYASVEQRDNPSYHGKPLVVGGRSARSVVAAASYEARKYGVRSAMPMRRALQRCPHLVVTPPRFEVYKKVSNAIRKVFFEYTDLVEPLSLDEAYLDVTSPKKGPPSASLIAKEIKQEIKKRVNLIASAGVSYNKFLAKIASDMDKPDGFYLIMPEDAEAFLEKLEIGKFFGVGKKTEEKMHKLGVFNGLQLKMIPEHELIRHFGKAGRYYYTVVRGIDERPVVSHREPKSIGAERTYQTDLFDKNEVKEKLIDVIDIMWERYEIKNKKAKTVTVKVRFADFTTITRRHTQHHPYTKTEVTTTIIEMVPFDEIMEKGTRLLGATMSNFEMEKTSGPHQLKINF